MNYLSHSYVSGGQSPEFIYGSFAPDIVGIAGARLRRVRPEIYKRHFLSPDEQVVQAGIDFHLLTDSVFDSQDGFMWLKRNYRDTIAPLFFSSDFRPAKGFADYGTEILLDGLLLKEKPEIAATFQDTIRQLGDRVLASAALTNSAALVHVARRYERGLPDYTDPEVVANILYRRTAGRKHISFPASLISDVAKSLELQQETVYESGMSLIEDTKLQVRQRAGLQVARLALLK